MLLKSQGISTKWNANNPVQDLNSLYRVSICPTPPWLCAECNARSIFNWFFFKVFLLLDRLISKIKGTVYPTIAGGGIVGFKPFLRVSVLSNAKSFVQDLDTGCYIHFLRPYPLYQEYLVKYQLSTKKY